MSNNQCTGVNVLSLFDGMSCGQIALERAGIKVNKYYASEIDKHAVKVSSIKYPNTIHLGDVTKVDVTKLDRIDILIGGSPCQGFSFAGKGLNFLDPRSALFFEYVRILNDIRAINPNVIFFLENVRMKKEHEDVISRILEIQPVNFNSNLVSAQNRERLYWTNIGIAKKGLFGDNYCAIEPPKDRCLYLRDVLQKDVAEKYYLSDKMTQRLLGNIKGLDEKANCFTAGGNSGGLHSDMTVVCVAMRGRNADNTTSRQAGLPTVQMIEPNYSGKTNTLTSVAKDNLVAEKYRIRRLTPIECCRLQTVDDDYFFDENGQPIVSETQMYKMLGNGWTVEMIVHFFKQIKLCKTN